MATATLKPPQPVTGSVFRHQKRFTLDEYHKIIKHRILADGAPYELLNGVILQKMTINPPHASAVSRLARRLDRLMPDGPVLRIQQPVSFRASDSEPEPDAAVAVGPEDRYDSTHPKPRDILLLVEVGDSSLSLDQGEKLIAYAAVRVPEYWVVNLIDRQVEVYTLPRGGKAPTYRDRIVYGPGQSVPVVIAGQTLGSIPVSELLP